MIQTILLQTIQGVSIETANASKVEGQAAAGDFAALLKTAEQVIPAAKLASPQAAAKTEQAALAAAELPLVLSPALSVELAGEPIAMPANAKTEQGESETDSSTPENASSDAREDRVDVQAAWLPAAMTAPAQAAPVQALPEQAALVQNAAPQAKTAAVEASTTAAATMPAAEPAGNRSLPDAGSTQRTAASQSSQMPQLPDRLVAQDAPQEARQTTAAPAAGKAQAPATQAEAGQPSVPAQAAADAARPASQQAAETQPEPSPAEPETQPAPSHPVERQSGTGVTPKAYAAPVPVQMSAPRQPAESTEEVTRTQPEIAAAVKAYAANVAAVSLAAAPDVEPETPAQTVPSSNVPAAANPDMGKASEMQLQQTGEEMTVAPAKAAPEKAEPSKTAAQRPVEASEAKVSAAETAIPANRSAVLPQGTNELVFDTLLRTDLNTSSAPVQPATTLPGAANTTPLANDPAYVRQALLDQTRQGIETGLQNGKTSLRLHLKPEDLGGIDLRVTAGPQGASVLIRAENPATGRLLEQNLSDLRHALQDAGVQLNNLSVGQQGAQSGPFSGQHAPSQHGLPAAFQRHAANQPGAAAADETDGMALRRSAGSSQVNYLV